MKYRSLALVGLLALLLYACGSDDDGTTPPASTPTATSAVTPTPALTPEPTPIATSTPAATASPTASGTPGGETGGTEGFRQFVTQLEVAITGSDTSFFSNRALVSEVPCEQLDLCGTEEPGTILMGVFSSVWRTDSIDLIPPEEIAQGLIEFVLGADASQSDEFGSGEAVIYALAQGTGEPFSLNISSAIITGLLRDEEGQLERRAQVYQFVFVDGRWMLFGQMSTGGLYGEWLSDGCTDCYDSWERWESLL